MKKNIESALRQAAGMSQTILLKTLQTGPGGLKTEQVRENRQRFGRNQLSYGKKESQLHKLGAAFINPFIAVLFILAGVSAFTDIIIPWSQGRRDSVDVTAVIIILTMVTISGILRYVQEARGGAAAAKLLAMVKIRATVIRGEEVAKELPLEEIVVGDLIHLSAGDMVPADVRILRAKDLFVSQAALTGESEPVEKMRAEDESAPLAGKRSRPELSLTDYPQLAFMGSNVISGTAEALVVAVGDQTLLGGMAGLLQQKAPATSFEKGVNSVSWVLIRFMLVMVPVIFFINGFTKGDWGDAFLFGLSVAIGLTPEMLPMIVTTCLAKGAVAMSQKKTIVKNLNSLQNFGAMDILCTDKTGTLTENQVVLEKHLDIYGQENIRVLHHAYLNSYFETGLKNLMDRAIIRRVEENPEEKIWRQHCLETYEKVDEIPFDFKRRRMSVVVADQGGKRQMITKGAVEEMLTVCSWVETGGQIKPLTQGRGQTILQTVKNLNQKGMRVLALAQKNAVPPAGKFGVADECGLVLMGYLAFLDPPKESAAQALCALKNYGVQTKILTGDNAETTAAICIQVGLDGSQLLLGSQLEAMNEQQLSAAVENYDVFAKLSPQQKALLVKTLRSNGHTVGFMGDGINDAPAMQTADVGISVDDGVDIAKEAASIILLEKDLLVLRDGIIEGRKTYANMIKYIKMTASSNFGNVLSVLAASAFLPFLPMAGLQLLLLNLIYDITCTALPWDNADKEFLQHPRKWEAASISSFMLWLGPVSSIFDIATFVLLYFVICPAVVSRGLVFTAIPSAETAMQMQYIAVFHSGWFVESMWTQTLIIHMLRTAKLPFVESRAPGFLLAMTGLGILTLSVVPYTAVGSDLGLAPLPGIFWGVLLPIVVSYMFLVTLVKKRYIKKYGDLY